MLNLIAWGILGLIAGAIAKAIYPGHQGGGILATMILGIVGAFVGGSLWTLLTKGTIALTGSIFSLPAFITAVVGAMIAIFIWGLITRRTA